MTISITRNRYGSRYTTKTLVSPSSPKSLATLFPGLPDRRRHVFVVSTSPSEDYEVSIDDDTAVELVLKLMGCPDVRSRCQTR